MTNSADPDQLASSEANWSGSALFAKTGHVVFSKRRVNVVFFISQNPIECQLCKFLILAVDKLVGENKTVDAVNHTLIELCNAFPESLKTDVSVNLDISCIMQKYCLTLSPLCANAADGKLKTFFLFLFSPGNTDWNFMQTVCLGKIKKNKKIQNVVCWNFYPALTPKLPITTIVICFVICLWF